MIICHPCKFLFLCSLFAIVCIWIIHGCYCCIELTVSSGYIYRCSRLVLPLPDRNRHVPVRNIPFPIFRNTGFVFPSDIPVPVPGQKIQKREWLRHFSDRSRPFSSPVRCTCFSCYKLRVSRSAWPLRCRA